MMNQTPTPHSAAPVISINGLHKSYGPLDVLKGVSMTAPRGHVVSLIGSSGSGKSTLLRCCNLLENSQAAVVDPIPLLAGRNLSNGQPFYSDAIRRTKDAPY